MASRAKKSRSSAELRLTESGAAMEGTEKFTFFWRKESPFSQHHACEFMVDALKYNCAEQYMMQQKAVTFQDAAIAEKIMATCNPMVQKRLGRAVKNFDPEVWNAKCKDIVTTANLAKFSQNAALWRKLAATAGTTLVEASPMDRKWGIGLGATNPRAKQRSMWRGENLLGQILTEVREQLMTELPVEPMKTEGITSDNTMHASCASTKEKEKFTFFWRKESPFSQHHACEFMVGGLKYNCAEQYMMHQKAVTFKDVESAEVIMATSDPVVQKGRGRAVKNFDPKVWNAKCKEVVSTANLAKFRQNAALWRELAATAGTTLVEASPMDCKWGIGLGEANPRAQQRSTWRGENLLGQILTEVREQLMKEGVDRMQDDTNQSEDVPQSAQPLEQMTEGLAQLDQTAEARSDLELAAKGQSQLKQRTENDLNVPCQEDWPTLQAAVNSSNSSRGVINVEPSYDSQAAAISESSSLQRAVEDCASNESSQLATGNAPQASAPRRSSSKGTSRVQGGWSN